MLTFTKLFSSLVTSSIWCESKETKILWVTMLAIKDVDGLVRGSVPGLAKLAGLSVAETEQSLKVLLSPDSYSHSKENGGRRIKRTDEGWLITNHNKYRELLTTENIREKDRKRKAAKKEHVEIRKFQHPDPDPDPDLTPLDPPVGVPSLDARREKIPGQQNQDRSLLAGVVPDEPQPSNRRTPKPRCCALPDDWVPTAEHTKRAAASGVNLNREAEKFRQHALANARRQANWNASFTTWLMKAEEFSARNRTPGQTLHEANMAEEDQALLHRAKRGEFGEKAKLKAHAGALDIQKLKSWLREKNARLLQVAP